MLLLFCIRGDDVGDYEVEGKVGVGLSPLGRATNAVSVKIGRSYFEGMCGVELWAFSDSRKTMILYLCAVSVEQHVNANVVRSVCNPYLVGGD